MLMSCQSHINALVGCAVLLPFSLLLLLLQLLDALLQHIRPKVTLKVRQLLSTGQTVLSCLLEDVLYIHNIKRVSVCCEELKGLDLKKDSLPFGRVLSVRPRLCLTSSCTTPEGVSASGSSDQLGDNGRCSRHLHLEDRPKCGQWCS